MENMSETLENVATYIRRSTAEQDDEHQLADIKDWLDRHNLAIKDVEVYPEQASGASEDRDKFLNLIEDIKEGKIDNVVVWEISRIARKGLLAQRFFDACEDNEVVIHVSNGSVREIRPDGTGRLVADIIASVAAEERRTLIRRTRSGQRRAREEGKWLGNVPKGFTRQDGYLKPNLNPDYDEGETGYLDIVEALELIENGMSYRQAAENTPHVTRQTLSNIDQDEEKRAWYTEQEAEDDRIQEALSEISC
ncbi:recombinase family protein [Natronobacterium gregoryi]|uniref:Resolvase n=2 Tax=Natronobacterium gregoryi TaxID=44930 RepID=L0AL71_NATGS|nr:recombinase family protein [Natronobacterium gregoryi]AFZ74623.1 site-specific recombinase, DNA invertase Pin [Natronobacterium gregoryi SP2]PLK19808.1 resolvase [Natronobacterium gregoryi SP2]SFJ30703.1 Site-specific DNA recombinase [Natronobacterium gregoryi]